MHIRTFQPGDETTLVEIYNTAAGELPQFKPATQGEIWRRCKGRDFDPSARFFAEVEGRPVGYMTFHGNGRMSYPWCLQGHEAAAEPLFQKALEAMRARSLTSAFAAYRTDWTAQNEFFAAHGFRLAREMVNFYLDQVEMPTRTGRLTNPITPLGREDLPAILKLAPGVLRVSTADQLEEYLFHNPYFTSDALFVLRSRANNELLAVGILVQDPAYADPKQVNAAMPCFRLGAFGTEGTQTKRINGLFSVLIPPRGDLNLIALELAQYAAGRLEESDVGTLAAQVPSDAPHLLRFYQNFFRRQGSFPVYERTL